MAHVESSGHAPRVSIVVPALNEAIGIGRALNRLQDARARGTEVVVVDGGSRDRTREIAVPLADRVLAAPRGRAVQMNVGAAVTAGEILLFLHADCMPPPDVDLLVHAAISGCTYAWGRFDVAIEGRSVALRVIATAMNLRSRLSGIATGDQGIFITRALYERIGGFPPIALMEDIVLSREAKRHSRPLCLRARILTSGRRWEQCGVMRTIVLMWQLRLAFFLGADPARLAARYGPGR